MKKLLSTLNTEFSKETFTVDFSVRVVCGCSFILYSQLRELHVCVASLMLSLETQKIPQYFSVEFSTVLYCRGKRVNGA